MIGKRPSRTAIGVSIRSKIARRPHKSNIRRKINKKPAYIFLPKPEPIVTEPLPINTPNTISLKFIPPVYKKKEKIIYDFSSKKKKIKEDDEPKPFIRPPAVYDNPNWLDLYAPQTESDNI